MGRSPGNPSESNGLKKGSWSIEEDQILMDYIHKHGGHQNWNSLPKKAGLSRCGKSCRLRWTNYLRPGIKRGNFSPEEEQTIIDLHSSHGNKWSLIASHLPRRTDNEIKNFWNTRLRKKLIQSGIDPGTHQPIVPDYSTSFQSGNLIVNPLENLVMVRIVQNILQVVCSNIYNPLTYVSGESATVVNRFDSLLEGMSIPQIETPPFPILESGDHDIFETSRMMGQIRSGEINSTGNTGNELPGLVPDIYSGSSNEVNYNNNGSVKIHENFDYNRLWASENSGDLDASETAARDDEAIGSFWRELVDESFPADPSGSMLD